MDDKQQNGAGFGQLQSGAEIGTLAQIGRAERDAIIASQIKHERAAQKHQHDQLAMASRLEALRLALGTSGDPAIVLSHAKAFAAFLQTGEVA